MNLTIMNIQRTLNITAECLLGAYSKSYQFLKILESHGEINLNISNKKKATRNKFKCFYIEQLVPDYQ